MATHPARRFCTLTGCFIGQDRAILPSKLKNFRPTISANSFAQSFIIIHTRKFFITNYFNDNYTWFSCYGMMNDNILDELDGLTDANTKSNAVNVTLNLNS